MLLIAILLALLFPCVAHAQGITTYPGRDLGNAILATPGQLCNMPFDNVSGWISLVPGGDLTCGGNLGQFTVQGIEGFPIVSVPPPGTANWSWDTDNSGNLVANPRSIDACTTVGCMNAVTTAGTPNTLAAVNTGNQGQVLTSNGTATLPSYQANEAPVALDFPFPGTVANSTNVYRVCPETLKYSPGFVASYPTRTARGIAETAPSAIDTYTFKDGASTVGYAYLQPSTGAANFGSPGCSPGFDGTQSASIQHRCASGGSPPQNCNATVPSNAVAGDLAILSCYVSGTDGTFTTPSGYSLVPNGSLVAGGSSIKLFEKYIGSGDLGAVQTCSYSTNHGSSSAVYVLKGGKTSGEAVDAVTSQQTSTTTCSIPTATPTANGDLDLVFCQDSTLGVTYSAFSAPLVAGNTLDGMGVATMYLGGTNATAAYTATATSSGIIMGMNVLVFTGSNLCTLCTAGDQTEVDGPATTQSEANLDLVFKGVQ